MTIVVKDLMEIIGGRPVWWIEGARKVAEAARALEGMFDWEKIDDPVYLDDQLAELLRQIEDFSLAAVRVDDPELADQLATLRADCQRLLAYARGAA